MSLSRRDVLRTGGLAGLAGLGLLSLPGCSAGSSGAGTAATGGGVQDMTLWYWGGGLSEAVVNSAVTQFASSVKLTPSQIGGDFKAKLQTTLTGGQAIPSITGVKGEDMPYFRSAAAKFVDLNTLGAKEIAAKATGLEWKWKEGQDATGKQLGYPIDIGPTAMFYRTDLFEKAGLPTDPAAVGDAVKTWDAFYELGTQLHGKVPTTFPVDQLASVWSILVGQSSQRFVSAENTFVGDSDELHEAWKVATKAQTLGLNANSSQTQAQDLGNGKIGAVFGAAWFALDLESGAPDTAGTWRVANNPVKPTNYGGSFLTIPTATKDPAKAFEIIAWILSTVNQGKRFEDAKIFPDDPAAWALPALNQGSEFFGGQKTIEVFGPAGKLVPTQYVAVTDGAVGAPYSDELTKVEGGKDPEKAWADAVAAAKQVAQRQGVK
ncbi:MAG: extracellular solute-binding protein [Actinobacteria bacterium]|nr:extracellular solute-binding protein [Actinomycetota bacterium]